MKWDYPEKRYIKNKRSLFERRCTAICDWLKAQGTPSRVAAIIVATMTGEQAKTICTDEKLEVPDN